MDGKTVRVQDDNEAAREIVLQANAKVEIIDKTLTLGIASAATVSSGTLGGGIIEFKGTATTTSRLRLHDQTTLQNIFVLTDPGIPGEITWADDKTDVASFTGMTFDGSVHFFMNAECTSSSGLTVFIIKSPSDVMLIGPDADPDPTDSTFNSYTMTGIYSNMFINVGIARFQRMDVNGLSGRVIAGAQTGATGGLVEVRHYANAAKLTNSTGLAFWVNDDGTLDIQSDVGGQQLSVRGGAGAALGRVKVKAGFLARFQDGL